MPNEYDEKEREGHKPVNSGAAGNDAGGSSADEAEWTPDKHVHATVDEINTAIGEIIEKDGGLPPLIPPGSSSDN